MFRVVPYTINGCLTDARVVVHIAFSEMEYEECKFYQLNLERSRIDTLRMNRTVANVFYLHT
jgi:hypothetical protein